MIVADKFGIDPADVEVLHSDTAISPIGLDTYGSRSLAVGGVAIEMAAEQVLGKARTIAAHQLECAEEDLEFVGGEFRVRGTPTSSMPIQAVAFEAFTAHNLPDGLEPNLTAQVTYDPPNFTFPFGTHVSVVEVDTETGAVSLLRYIAVDDCGNQINPLIVEGQIHGGVVQGVAQALWEEAVYDDDGNLRNPTMIDYCLPSAAEVPSLELGHTVTPSPTNPLGVKGIGEAGTIGSAPCIINAVVDALSPYGITDVEMPAKPERVWSLIRGGTLMIPAAFDYARAESVDDAVALLGRHGDDAKLLAGGHSLLPLMKLRLATPAVLIDIGRIQDLSYVRAEGGEVRVGALTCHADLEGSDVLREQVPLLAHVAGQVGDPQVRHRGTIGGSIAHGDPASDLPAALLALRATLVARGPGGERTIAVDDFFTGFLETALAADEVLTEIRVPAGPDAGWSFQKFNRRAQDWAIVGVAAVVAGSGNGARRRRRPREHGSDARPVRRRRGGARLGGVGSRCRRSRRRGARALGRSQRVDRVPPPPLPRPDQACAGGGGGLTSRAGMCRPVGGGVKVRGSAGPGASGGAPGPARSRPGPDRAHASQRADVPASGSVYGPPPPPPPPPSPPPLVVVVEDVGVVTVVVGSAASSPSVVGSTVVSDGGDSASNVGAVVEVVGPSTTRTASAMTSGPAPRVAEGDDAVLAGHGRPADGEDGPAFGRVGLGVGRRGPWRPVDRDRPGLDALVEPLAVHRRAAAGQQVRRIEGDGGLGLAFEELVGRVGEVLLGAFRDRGGHVLLPDLGRERPAGHRPPVHVVHRHGAVGVAHPDDRRVAGDVAGEPGVDVPLGRTRLARRGPADVGGGARARLDHLSQGVGHGPRDAAVDPGAAVVVLGLPHDVAVAVLDPGDGVGLAGRHRRRPGSGRRERGRSPTPPRRRGRSTARAAARPARPPRSPSPPRASGPTSARSCA